MKEWQTACEEAHSLLVDWWDKSWGSSWGIPYQHEHTNNIKKKLKDAIKTGLWPYFLLPKCVFCKDGNLAIEP